MGDPETTPASPEPDYRVLLTKFMGFVWEDDCVVCERCADGTWGKYEPHEQAAMNEILAAVKEVSNVD